MIKRPRICGQPISSSAREEKDRCISALSSHACLVKRRVPAAVEKSREVRKRLRFRRRWLGLLVSLVQIVIGGWV